MRIKDLIKLLEKYDEDSEIECFISADGADYNLDIEGVGTIEDDEVIYIYAKDE